MDKLLESDCLQVLEVRTVEELHARLLRFTKSLGFEFFSAMAVVDHLPEESEFIAIDNAPVGYRARIDDLSLAKFDPVSQHCKRRSTPIVWDQSAYLEVDQADLWEEQAGFGYACGVSMAAHLPHGRHFLFGLDRTRPLPHDPAERMRMVASLQLFAAYAQEAAMPILAPSAGVPSDPGLTHRELESLRWTLEGKTAWEVGRILGIAENTVIRHTHHAAQKLGCTSKHHAAVKALRMGLIC